MQHLFNEHRSVAYFSMEIGINDNIKTYSGGLGVLAGDTIRSSADLRIPMVAVTLLYRKGYFKQNITDDGWQIEEPAEWKVEDYLEPIPQSTVAFIEGRTVHIKAWKLDVKGVSGYTVPIYFLDTDLPENSEYDRNLTHYLYGGDEKYRLCQEVILGVGGIRMLRSLGYRQIESFHMNEGHAALLTLELLDEHAKRHGRGYLIGEDRKAVRKRCVFTTHTIVPAGHDKFSHELAKKIIGERADFFSLEGVLNNQYLNMTLLALNFSRYVNGVAKKHGEASRLIFVGYSISSITNGVHAATWISEPFKKLFDNIIPIWRSDNFSLRYVLNIPKEDIWNAHVASKQALIDFVKQETGESFDIDALTIGFARRAATYKRADLLFQDIERLKRISNEVGKIQIIYAGKAHPRDFEAKKLIQKIYGAQAALKDNIKVVYLRNYNMNMGALLTSGVDIWLNTPIPPMEASGTSGMKAAMNGVPNLSILDGWWIEGNIEGLTGWGIGELKDMDIVNNNSVAANMLYDKLETIIIPLYYHKREDFIDIMRHSIAINGSFFNTHRMMYEYVLNAYFSAQDINKN